MLKLQFDWYIRNKSLFLELPYQKCKMNYPVFKTNKVRGGKIGKSFFGKKRSVNPSCRRVNFKKKFTPFQYTLNLFIVSLCQPTNTSKVPFYSGEYKNLV